MLAVTDGISDKIRRFIHEYVACRNISLAAKRVGYTRERGRQLVTEHPIVSEIISRYLEFIGDSPEINNETILRETALVAFFDPAGMFNESGKLMRVVDMDPHVRRAIASVKVLERSRRIIEIKLHDKLTALEKLGKYAGTWGPEKHEHTGKNGGPIEIEHYSGAKEAFERRIAMLSARIAETPSHVEPDGQGSV